MSANFDKVKETIRERTRILLEKGDFSDCEFHIGDKKTKVMGHKIIMAIASPVFLSMFYGQLKEECPIAITDLEPQGFKGMLQYIYTDDIIIKSVKHALLIYQSAKKYILPFLEFKCEVYIRSNLNAASACEVFEFALSHKYVPIEHICVSIFTNDTEEVLNSDGFLESSEQTVEKIVTLDTLNVKSEMVVFKAVQNWSQAHAKRQGKTLDELAPTLTGITKNLRFMAMEPVDFVSEVGSSALINPEVRLAVLANLVKPDTVPWPAQLPKLEARCRPPPPVPRSGNGENQMKLKRNCHAAVNLSVSRRAHRKQAKMVQVVEDMTLLGITFKTRHSNPDEPYHERIIISINDGKWSIKELVDDKKAQSRSEKTVMLKKPVELIHGRKYSVELEFFRSGMYPVMEDLQKQYRVNNTIVYLGGEKSSITELIFVQDDIRLAD